MSPRAAWRLESLGFQEVYDYVAGEADWFANGLPMEGTNAAIPHAGDLAKRDVPTCQLTDSLRDVLNRVKASGWDTCIVVNNERIVLGILRLNGIDASSDATVEDHMESGPSTWRPDATLDQPLAHMERRKVESVIVTTSDGRLVGLLRRSDIKDRRIQMQ